MAGDGRAAGACATQVKHGFEGGDDHYLDEEGPGGDEPSKSAGRKRGQMSLADKKTKVQRMAETKAT